MYIFYGVAIFRFFDVIYSVAQMTWNVVAILDSEANFVCNYHRLRNLRKSQLLLDPVHCGYRT